MCKGSAIRCKGIRTAQLTHKGLRSWAGDVPTWLTHSIEGPNRNHLRVDYGDIHGVSDEFRRLIEAQRERFV